jgi:hypothetical protein
MKKVIRQVDEKKGVVQVTVADERWYLRPKNDPKSGVPNGFDYYPSITWIVGCWPKGIEFYKWLAQKGWDEAESIKESAGNRGSAVHAAIELILKGEEFRIDTQIVDQSKSTETNLATRELTFEELVAVKSFLDWKEATEKDYHLETLAIETVLMSDKYKAGGTLDWLVKLTPKEGDAAPTFFLVDFKTSKQVWITHKMQVSAYRRMLLDEIGEKNKEGITEENLKTAILQLGYHLNKNKYKFTEVEDCFNLFELAYKIWETEEGEKESGLIAREFPIVLANKRKTE